VARTRRPRREAHAPPGAPGRPDSSSSSCWDWRRACAPQGQGPRGKTGRLPLPSPSHPCAGRRSCWRGMTRLRPLTMPSTRWPLCLHSTTSRSSSTSPRTRPGYPPPCTWPPWPTCAPRSRCSRSSPARAASVLCQKVCRDCLKGWPGLSHAATS